MLLYRFHWCLIENSNKIIKLINIHSKQLHKEFSGIMKQDKYLNNLYSCKILTTLLRNSTATYLELNHLENKKQQQKRQAMNPNYTWAKVLISQKMQMHMPHFSIQYNLQLKKMIDGLFYYTYT